MHPKHQKEEISTETHILAVLAKIAAVIVLCMALEHAAAVRMPWEQMMEDEEQRVCIESWMRRKGRLGVIDNTAGTPFEHNGEPSEISGKNAKNG